MDVKTPTTAEVALLYQQEGPKLWRAVFAYAGDREVASDAVAEAFAQFIRRGGGVREPRAWIWRAAFRDDRGADPRSADAPTLAEHPEQRARHEIAEEYAGLYPSVVTTTNPVVKRSDDHGWISAGLYVIAK